jgi:hypothetical protein
MTFVKWAPNHPVTKPGYHCLDVNAQDSSFTLENYPCTGFVLDAAKNAYPVENFVVCEMDET